MDWNGQARKTMIWANRNGFMYVLDRVAGKFLLGKPFVQVNWASGFDENGRPMRVPGKVPTPEGTLIFPGNQGGTNWYSAILQPAHRIVLHSRTWENYSSVYIKAPVRIRGGAHEFMGASPRSSIPGVRAQQVNTRKEEEGFGAVRAFDPKTGDKKWEFKMADVTDSGILTTASDVLFTGGREGYFFALDARTGDLLWKSSVGGQVASGPMSYSVNARQYVAISAGSSLFVYALRQ